MKERNLLLIVFSIVIIVMIGAVLCQAEITWMSGWLTWLEELFSPESGSLVEQLLG